MGAIEDHKVYGLKIRESANDGSDFGTPDTDYRFLFLGEDGKLHVKDAANAVSDPYTAGGGGISSGTSFPGSPANNDLYYRTDRDLLYFYDGTRWLTVNLYRSELPTLLTNGTISINGAFSRGATFEGDYDIWVEKFYGMVYVPGTNNGSNYWTCSLVSVTSAIATTTLGSFDTSADTGSTFAGHSASVGALLGTNKTAIQAEGAKTGSPANATGYFAYTYRLVG